MSVIIRKEGEHYELYNVTHNPVFLGGVFNDFATYMKWGRIIPLTLEIDVEYPDLHILPIWINNKEHKSDFIEVHRIPMNGKGDIVTYVYKEDYNLYNRGFKLERILK